MKDINHIEKQNDVLFDLYYIFNMIYNYLKKVIKKDNIFLYICHEMELIYNRLNKMLPFNNIFPSYYFRIIMKLFLLIVINSFD